MSEKEAARIYVKKVIDDQAETIVALKAEIHQAAQIRFRERDEKIARIEELRAEIERLKEVFGDIDKCCGPNVCALCCKRLDKEIVGGIER